MGLRPFAGFSGASAYRAAAVTLAWMLSGGLAGAAETQPDEGALSLEADSFRHDKSTGNSLYRGNVVISRDGMRLTGDEVEVFSTDGEFSRLVARARPCTFRIRSADGNVDARADVIEYDVKRRVVVFMGGAVINDGEKLLRSEHVTYDLAGGVVAATKSKGRVRMTINP